MRLQDLPAEHVISFFGMPPGYKEAMGMKLLILASGAAGESALTGLTYGEVEHMMSEWLLASAESEESDQDGGGSGLDLDWGLLLR